MYFLAGVRVPEDVLREQVDEYRTAFVQTVEQVFCFLIIIINTAAYSFVCNWQVTRIDDALAEYIDEDRQETKTNFPDAGHGARAQTVYRKCPNCNLESSNQLSLYQIPFCNWKTNLKINAPGYRIIVQHLYLLFKFWG